MEEYNETINNGPIKRKMYVINLRVTPDKYKSLPDYMKRYCNINVSRISCESMDVVRITVSVQHVEKVQMKREFTKREN